MSFRSFIVRNPGKTHVIENFTLYQMVPSNAVESIFTAIQGTRLIGQHFSAPCWTIAHCILTHCGLTSQCVSPICIALVMILHFFKLRPKLPMPSGGGYRVFFSGPYCFLEPINKNIFCYRLV